jgi:hypothetical protein
VATVGSHSVNTFTSPVVATSGLVDANVVRGNDNALRTSYNTHDADAAIHVQSGLLSARPVSLPDGGMYVATDTDELYFYSGGSWHQVGGTPSAYGAWQDTTDQTASAINTPTLFTFNTIDVESGVTLASSSRITVPSGGTYNLQWSGQFINTDSNEQDVWIWIRKNGTNVVGSAGQVSVPKRHGSVDGHLLPSWNYYLPLNANDYIQLYWAVTNLSVSLQAVPAPAFAPSTASIIATIEKV